MTPERQPKKIKPNKVSVTQMRRPSKVVAKRSPYPTVVAVIKANHNPSAKVLICGSIKVKPKALMKR